MSETTITKPNLSTRVLSLLRSLCRPIIMLPFIGLTVVILLTALYGNVHAIRLPSADGKHKYKVAVSHFPLTDTARKDPYKPDEVRRLMVSLYMPVPKESCSNECQNSYMPPQTAAIANEQFIEGGKRDAGIFELMPFHEILVDVIPVIRKEICAIYHLCGKLKLFESSMCCLWKCS